MPPPTMATTYIPDMTLPTTGQDRHPACQRHRQQPAFRGRLVGPGQNIAHRSVQCFCFPSSEAQVRWTPPCPARRAASAPMLSRDSTSGSPVPINHIQRWIERAGPTMAPILRLLRDLKQNTGAQNSGCRPRPYRVFGRGPESVVFASFEHRASSVPAVGNPENSRHRSVQCFVERLIAGSSRRRKRRFLGKPVTAAGCQAPSFAALPRAHVFIRSLQVTVVDAVPIRRTDQHARSWVVSCDVGWRWACLTAWRPPSVSGCRAAPVKAFWQARTA